MVDWALTMARVRFVTVTCPECRATEAEPLDEGHYRCRHCSSTFLREQAPGQAQAQAPAAPRTGGRRIGLIGGGALLALGAIGGAALVGKSGKEEPEQRPRPRPVPVAPRPVARMPQATPGKPARVELREVRGGRTSIGGLFWLARYANVGDVVVERPAVVVSLFDEAGHRVEEQSGWAPIHRLAPKEETPVLVLISRPPPHARAEIAPRPPQADRGWGGRQLRLEVKEQTYSAGSNALVGTVRNPTEQAVRFAQIIVVGKDAQGALASYATGSTTRPGLPPAMESGFKVYLSGFQLAPPARFDVLAVGSY
jgi:hypothetical protein